MKRDAACDALSRLLESDSKSLPTAVVMARYGLDTDLSRCSPGRIYRLALAWQYYFHLGSTFEHTFERVALGAIATDLSRKKHQYLFERIDEVKAGESPEDYGMEMFSEHERRQIYDLFDFLTAIYSKRIRKTRKHWVAGLTPTARNITIAAEAMVKIIGAEDFVTHLTEFMPRPLTPHSFIINMNKRNDL